MGLHTASGMLSFLLSTLLLVLSSLQAGENIPLKPLHLLLLPELRIPYHHSHPWNEAILSLAISRWRLRWYGARLSLACVRHR